MSNIPKARELLLEALTLLDREKPKFRAAKKYPRLTEPQKREARFLREDYGLSLNEIAQKLNTNIGRVSEAVNQ